MSLIEALRLLPESMDRLATGAVSLQWRHTSLISVPCVLAAMAFAFSPARPYAHRKLALLGAAALCFIANPAGLLPCTIFSLPYYAVKGCSGESLRAGHATIGAVGTMMWIMLALWEHARMTHRRAVRPRACVRCGYNLSGNTTNHCPECGEREASE